MLNLQTSLIKDLSVNKKYVNMSVIKKLIKKQSDLKC